MDGRYEVVTTVGHDTYDTLRPARERGRIFIEPLAAEAKRRLGLKVGDRVRITFEKVPDGQ